MSRIATVLFLSLALLLAVSAWADVKVEESFIPADVSPVIGPAAPSGPMDNMWDFVWGFDAQTSTTNLLVGASCAGGYFWATGAGLSSATTTDNKIYKFSLNGTLLATYNQPDVLSGWGFRDMAWDGTYLYAGCEGAAAYAWDLNGNMVPTANVPKPAGCSIIRALAYDPATDHFWTGNFSSAIFEFDRAGNVIWTGAAGMTGIYGMAWDDVAPDGPWLWIYDQSGTPATAMKKYNPVTHTVVQTFQLPLPPGLTAGTAGGCEMTNAYDPGWWQMVAMIQGTPVDMVALYEMYLALSVYAPAAPTGFTVSSNGIALMASLVWTNPTLQINGLPLASITDVKIKRGANVVATLNGTPGQAMSYIDVVPSAGNYAYQVYCTNDSGNGQPANASNWIGLDTPGPASGVTATPAWLSATVSWTAPTTGQHGGYWPAGSWNGQKIYRGGALLTTLVGTNTQYTDNTLTQGGPQVYGVAYYNSSGDGSTVNAPSVVIPGPGIYVYAAQPYNWVEINPAYPGSLPGINTGLNADDQNLGPFPIGFSYPFYGANRDSVRMCSNGFASFTATTTALTNAVIPTAAEPNNLLAVYWDDLNMNPTSGSGAAFYYYDAPNSRFIMEWDSVSHYGSTITGEYFTFEILLYTNGTIDYIYKAIVPGTTTPFPSATAGVENSTGTIGTQCTFNGSGPLEPVTGTGIRFYEPQAPVPVQITIAPISTPIVIPASGGSFDYNVSAVNMTTSPYTFDVWIMVQLPSMVWWGPALGPVNLTLPAGFTLSRIRTQNVPAGAPAGTYYYEGRVGTYPSTILSSSGFNFEKSALGDGGSWVSEWSNYGESFEAWASSAAPLPTEIGVNAYPNPFNPSTTLNFTLPEAAQVKLTVYDLTGRTVATLVNGYRAAGAHRVTFDGSNLASGLYLYRLSAGGTDLSGKMMLVK